MPYQLLRSKCHEVTQVYKSLSVGAFCLHSWAAAGALPASQELFLDGSCNVLGLAESCPELVYC